MLKLKLQYFGHLMLRKIEGRRRRGKQRMGWLDSIINSMDMNLSKLQEIVKDKGAWRAAGQGRLACCSPGGHKELDTTERLNNKLFLGFLQR